jgi:hypothetical protein
MTAQHGQVQRLIEGTRRRLRAWRWLVFALAWFAVPPLGLLLAAVLEHLGDHEPASREALRGGLEIAAVVWLAVLLLGAVWVFVLRRHWPGRLETASRIGWGSTAVRDRLLNALQVVEAGRENRAGFDPGLIAASLDAVVPDLDGVDPRRVLPVAARRRALQVAAAGWGLALLLLLLGGADARLALWRLAEPQRDFRPEAPFTLAIEVDWPDPAHPGRVLSGQALPLRVRPDGGQVPEQIELVARQPGSAERIWQLPLRRGVAGLEDLQPVADLELQARAQSLLRGRRTTVESATLPVRVLRPPMLDSLVLSVQPPRYTGLAGRQLPAGSGDLLVPAGSLVRATARSSKPLLGAWRVDEPAVGGARQVALNGGDGSLETEFRARADGRWGLELLDQDSLRLEPPLRWSLRVIPDRPPVLRVLAPEEPEGRLERSLKLPLLALAEDDYGFAGLDLVWLRVGAVLRDLVEIPDPATLDAPPAGWSKLPLPLEPLSGEGGDQRRAAAEQDWDLRALDLLPDDELFFYFELRDNDGWNGSKAVRSGLYRFKMPGLEELFADAEQTGSELVAEAEEILQRTRRNQEKLHELSEEMRREAEPELSWERRQRLKQIAREQQELLERGTEVGRRLEELEQQLQRNDLISTELQDKMRRLKEALQQAISPELLERLRQVAEETRPPENAAERQRPLQDLEEVLRKMEEQLDRFLAVLEEMRLEQRLEELARRAEELLERQRELSRDPSSERQRQAEAQRQQSEEARSLQQAIEQLEQEFGQRPDFPQEALQEAGAQLEDKRIPPRLQEMGEQLAGGESPSEDAGERMDQDLNQLAETLQQALQQSRRQAREQLAKELEKVGQELLLISHGQEAISLELPSLGRRSARLPELADRTLEQRLGVQASAAEVDRLARASFHVPPGVLAQLGGALDQLDGMLGGFHERRLGEVGRQSPQAMGFVNAAILQIKQAAANLQASPSASGFEELMEQLSQASSRQQCLNGQCDKLMCNTPGQGQKPMSISFGEAQGEQQGIREELEALSERLGEDGKPQLGDLGQVAADMREVEQDLANLSYTERTQRLQERILSRLLDAQRSIRRQDQSKKREGRAAEPLFAPPPAPLELQAERDLERDLLRALRGSYAPEMEELIRDYFRALEREETRNQSGEAADAQ